MESYYKQNKKLITDILDILEGHFGKNVEFVVHDLSLDYEHTIVDIRNGEVTGRKVGGTGDLLGLRALRYNGSNEGNCFNTLTYAENGKILALIHAVFPQWRGRGCGVHRHQRGRDGVHQI